MRIFKNTTVAGAMTCSFCSGIIFYANLFYVRPLSSHPLKDPIVFILINRIDKLPQFYQVVRSATPLESGTLILPLLLTQTITSFTSGALVSKTGDYKINLWLGFAIWAVACGLLSTVSPTMSNGQLIGYQILSGISAGQTFQTNLIAIQASVKRSEMAVATGTRNFLRLLGGTVTLAVCTAILNNTVR